MIKYILSLIILLSALNVSFGQTEKSLSKNPPKLTEYVTDETGTLKADEIVSLKTKLRKFYDSTSTQILVLLIPSLNGEPIEMVANSIYHSNGIGAKGKDNGALILISKGDRKIRIEVGYGLEGVLTDAASKMIIKREMNPELKVDNYYKGIDNAVNAIIALSKNEYSIADMNKSNGTGIVFIVLMLLFPAIIIIIIISAVIKRKKDMLGGTGGYYGTNYYSGSGSDNYSSGSSDSSSGSDSGFSGGGGDSGGGGASGDY